MKYIKTFERYRAKNIFSSYLYPISIKDLTKYCDYLNKYKVDFTLYENGVKFLKAKNLPFPVLDFLIYFEDSDFEPYGNKVDNSIKMRSLKFKSKSQISKWVGAKIKNIDLYINADKYNL